MELALAGGQGTVEVAERAFAVPYNEGLVHQVVTAYLAAARAGTRAQKTRAEVRGGGAKPWRQKGMGRARAGSSRSPLWRGGGVTFAARPASHAQKVNRKMYRGALRCICSELARQGRLLVLERFELEAPKTRELVARLRELELEDVLVVSEGEDRNLELAARNLHHVAVLPVDRVGPVELIAFERVLITVAALRRLEGRLA